MDKRYVQFPTSFIEFLKRAALGHEQFKMLLITVRHCHGFHKPNRTFDLVDLRHWIGWDRRKIFRVAQSLCRRCIFLLCVGEKAGGKYAIENDAQKWCVRQRFPKSEPVDNLRDTSVNQAELPLLQPVDNSTYPQVRPVQFSPKSQPVDNFIDTSLVPQNLALHKTVDNPVDNPVDKSWGGARMMTLSLTNDDTFLTNDDSPPSYPQANSPSQATEVTSVFRNLSTDTQNPLKKLLKKYKETPDHSDLKKGKNEIFKEMARSGLWNDDELIDLAAAHDADQLRALFAAKKRRTA